MPKRTQIICMHEGKQNSIDSVFAHAFLKAYKPNWLRISRFTPCGDKTRLLEKFPEELKVCGMRGADTTLIVIADVDDDCKDCDVLKEKYRLQAKRLGLSDDLFERVVFIFPKDRIENWIEFFNTGHTDESKEGPRVEPDIAAKAAKKLADICKNQDKANETFPLSLQWSCRNWKALIERMR